MRSDDARPIIEALLDHHERRQSWRTAATTIPAEHYVGEPHLATELDQLFGRTPHAVALTADVPGPNDHVTRSLPDRPLVLVRGDDGVARGFANVCAHRGSQVVGDGHGCSRRLTCPYHAWTYDSAGDLVGVPDRDAFPDVNVPGPGLHEHPVTEQHGIIWLHPDRHGSPPAPDLGPFERDLESFAIDDHIHWRSHRFELELNWKLVIDTFLEGYHFASLHRTTVGPLFLPNLCHATRHGPHVREVLPRRSIVELRDQPPDTWDLVPHSALVYVLFPSTVFVMQIDHLETWRVRPDPRTPGQSICELDFYIPRHLATEAMTPHWEKNWDLTIDTVISEDFDAMAGVQRGLASGAIEELRVGANEPALGLFHAALADALGP